MRERTAWIAVLAMCLMLAVAVRVTGQAPAQPPPQPATQPPPTTGHGGPPPPGTPAQPPGPREQPRFPAHQRPPADPAVVERGRGLYVGACAACHGVDARGGQLGGPNLLRSQLVLNDQDGELILPIVKNGRPGTPMVPIAMPDADVKAVATYLHALQALGSNQGGPPPGEEAPLNILVGNAKAGEKFFQAKCSSCHSPTGDLQGIATRIPEPKALQNTWVAGRTAGRGFGPPAANGSGRGVVTAVVTQPGGEKVEGRLLRIDDFLVAIALADGTTRSFRRAGDVPQVEVRNPLAGHQALLAVLTDINMHDVTAYLATLK
jgi:cytochrome c oxidase cbb3-type subunit III